MSELIPFAPPPVQVEDEEEYDDGNDWEEDYDEEYVYSKVSHLMRHCTRAWIRIRYTC
jgi:hypothetical protein